MGHQSVLQAAKVGQMLIELKAQCPHKGEGNFRARSEIAMPKVSTDTINNLMTLARNLTPDKRMLLLGRRYNREKKKHGAEAGGRGNQHVVKDQIDTLPTAEKLAQQHGVSPATVKRAGQYAAAVDVVTKAMPDVAPGAFVTLDCTKPGTGRLKSTWKRGGITG